MPFILGEFYNLIKNSKNVKKKKFRVGMEKLNEDLVHLILSRMDEVQRLILCVNNRITECN